MINKKMFKEIQTFKRQGLSKSAIVKTLELDPRTVARYFAMREEEYRIWRQVRQFRDKGFDDLKSDILEVYAVNENQPLQISSVYDYLKEWRGALPGNEQTLRHYVAYLIETKELKLADAVRTYTKVPELPSGRQMQLGLRAIPLPKRAEALYFRGGSFGQPVQVRGFPGSAL